MKIEDRINGLNRIPITISMNKDVFNAIKIEAKKNYMRHGNFIEKILIDYLDNIEIIDDNEEDMKER